MFTFPKYVVSQRHYQWILKILGHRKGGDLDLVLDLEGLGIDVLDLGPEIDADILLGLDPKKDEIEKRKENADKKAFLRSKQKPQVVSYSSQDIRLPNLLFLKTTETISLRDW